jgi:hypothetical protein
MKALLGNLAKIIKNDPDGKKQLKDYISNSSQDSVITLSDGKKYKISNSPKNNAAA